MIPIHRLLCSLVIISLISITSIPAADATEYTVAPSGAEFTSIQAAINRAFPGDTILVKSGTYRENLLLDKKIDLIGVDSGGGAPIIDPVKKGNAMEIHADSCRVEGFTIQNIELLNGIRVKSSMNTIRRNTFLNNANGIFLVSAIKNTIYGNTITNSSQFGIALEDSNENLIEENILSKNSIGIELDRYSLSNLIYRNNFDNPQNVISKSATSVWSSPDPFTYTYLGLNKQSYMGNYWSDYRGKDKNGDGIGDISYGIMIGANPIAIFESDQNIIDAFPLMDPLPYYYDVVPVRGGVITPQPMTLPTFPGISHTTYPATIPHDVTPIPSSIPSTSAEKTANEQPTDFLMVELIVLLLAGAVVLIIFRQIKHKESKQEFLPDSKDATPRQKTSRTSLPGISSAATIPEAGTAVPKTSRTSTSIAEQMNFFPNELVSKYTEIKYIGRGGIAWVFSARRKSDAMMVAVKIPISFDEMTGKSFLNEIAVWETLRHPNIVKVTAVNILPVPFVEMEYVPDALEAIEKPIPVRKAVHLIRGIADGLKYAHEQGFIHRDIKPHNILLDKDFIPKITDWGMSKVLANEVKKSSIAGFSLSYAAPEQVSPSDFGRTDERTDIYQLGVVFYELVTGSVPFGGESIVEVGNAILREQPIPPSEFNSDAALVEKIILKCLEKDPVKRYQSSAELLDALHGYLAVEDK
ncbi:MAG TPA: protein kinase [Methanoregula sp.]|nr:protein kinase [Methanoregula sp.]